MIIIYLPNFAKSEYLRADSGGERTSNKFVANKVPTNQNGEQ